MSTHDDSRNWQLYFGSKLTIVLVLCLSMTLSNNNWWLMPSTHFYRSKRMTTSVSRWLNMLCIMCSLDISVKNCNLYHNKFKVRIPRVSINIRRDNCCWKVLCQLRTWYWQLHFGSKVTIFSLISHPMAVWAI